MDPSPPADARVLPTVDEDTLGNWRQQFAAEIGEKGSKPNVQDWLAKTLPAHVLDPPLRRAWYGFLKARVSERITVWFDAQEITPPVDVVKAKQPTQKNAGDALRQYVIRVVSQMTDTELDRLSLPVSATLRAAGRRE